MIWRRRVCMLNEVRECGLEISPILDEADSSEIQSFSMFLQPCV